LPALSDFVQACCKAHANGSIVDPAASSKRRPRNPAAKRHDRPQLIVPGDGRIVFRIGDHPGDVVEESDGDLMDEGIAASLGFRRFTVSSFMFHYPLGPALRLTAVYAILCLFWVGLSEWVAPKIIIAAYHEHDIPVLDWALQGHRSLPINHYLYFWRSIATAVPLAAGLHWMIVLLICGIDRKQRDQCPNSVIYKHCNVVLITFSAAFLALAVLTGIQGDYRAYVMEWIAVLAGRDPWDLAAYPINAYGPLFNALALLVRVSPLANKLLFAFSYLVYVIWLVKVFAPRRGLDAFSWRLTALWLLSPFPWVQIAYVGYFDILVSLACVAAIHNLIGRKDGVSGTYLALGILLKFLPIVILPFLAFNQRRLHFRLLGFCLGIVCSGFLVSLLVWGKSTFAPLAFAATRRSEWSIYNVLTSTHSPLRYLWQSPNLEWLEKPLLFIAGLAVFVWCILRQIEPARSSALAILVTLLFYRVGFANYQMVVFSLVLYWSVSNWEQFSENPVLTALLIIYFGFLAIADIAMVCNFVEPIFHSEIVIGVFQFLSGCALLVGLAQLRPAHARVRASPGKPNTCESKVA
jgi:hypothetical protein